MIRPLQRFRDSEESRWDPTDELLSLLKIVLLWYSNYLFLQEITAKSVTGDGNQRKVDSNLLKAADPKYFPKFVKM